MADNNNTKFSMADVDCKERELKLYSVKIKGIPLWRIVRGNARRRLAFQFGYSQKTRKVKLNTSKTINYIWDSLRTYIGFFFKKRPHVDNVFFAFPRLYKFQSSYIDRISDPVIMQTELNNSFYVFQRSEGGKYVSPRKYADRTFKLDFIIFTALFLSKLLSPLVRAIYKNKIDSLYVLAKPVFDLNDSDRKQWGVLLGKFLIEYKLYYWLLKRIKPKRVFVVSRGVFYSAILACKKLGVTVYELQHGITHGPTILYSGEYNPLLDPDYFLTFGEKCVGPYYGVPIDKILNIGWAYKSILPLALENECYDDNVVLVVSQPALTTRIVNTVVLLAKEYPQYEFHIRAHPQEQFFDEHIEEVEQIVNVKLVDNAEESFQTVFKYPTVLGENSSVIYEALSMGKRVGRLAFNGFSPSLSNQITGGVSLHNINEFKQFMNEPPVITAGEYYSEFNVELVNNLK